MIYRQQGKGLPAELRAIRTANPAIELRKAIAKRDLRFLGVAQSMLSVPGVPGQASNPLVGIRGIHTIEGTSDATRYFEEDVFQDAAWKYAEKYNHLLYEHLLRVNDPAVAQARHKIDKELLRMEQGDPIREAKQAVQTASLYLIELPDKACTTPGIDSKVLKAVKQAYSPVSVFGSLVWPWVFVAEIMTPLQHQRLARHVTHYMVPYNRYLFAHYQPIAIIRLFKRGVRVGTTLNEIATILHPLSWPRENDVEMINTLAGRIPVKMTAQDTTFVMRLLSHGGKCDAAIYIRLREKISSTDLKNILVKGIASSAGYIEVAEIACEECS